MMDTCMCICYVKSTAGEQVAHNCILLKNKRNYFCIMLVNGCSQLKLIVVVCEEIKFNLLDNSLRMKKKIYLCSSIFLT